jgi:hypothetical protein
MIVVACFLVLFAVFGTSVPARADNIVNWTLSGASFGNGAALTGYVIVDYTGITRALSWDITADSGPAFPQTMVILPATEFTTANSSWGEGGNLSTNDGTFILAKLGYPGGGSSSPTAVWWATSYNYVTSAGVLDVNIASGAWVATPLSSVPLPGAFLLLGPGLASLAAVRRRFRR